MLLLNIHFTLQDNIFKYKALYSHYLLMERELSLYFQNNYKKDIEIIQKCQNNYLEKSFYKKCQNKLTYS